MLFPYGDLKPENHELFRNALIEILELLRKLDNPSTDIRSLGHDITKAKHVKQLLRRIELDEHLIIGGKKQIKDIRL